MGFEAWRAYLPRLFARCGVNRTQARRCFSQARDTYVKARYSPHYQICAEICAERLGGLPDPTEDVASSPFPSD
ncbi:hypothetical protein [Methylobacterium sp. NFXW15]|uniref:hypothetical protein n=1 Tax=Methylobacterium sp. NFXW15 TaxID=2819512 RepID=UPI003CF9B2F2